MINGTEPAVNQLHHTLRVLAFEDPSLERAIAFGVEAIRLQGYDKIKRDPGMYAWIMENHDMLCEIAQKRRRVV